MSEVVLKQLNRYVNTGCGALNLWLWVLLSHKSVLAVTLQQAPPLGMVFL